MARRSFAAAQDGAIVIGDVIDRAIVDGDAAAAGAGGDDVEAAAAVAERDHAGAVAAAPQAEDAHAIVGREVEGQGSEARDVAAGAAKDAVAVAEVQVVAVADELTAGLAAE